MIFAALALYPITLRATRRNRFAGVVAVLVAGLLSPMPAYYINWGRYAQLAGQVILPVVMLMIWDVTSGITVNPASPKWSQVPLRKIILTSAVITGMILFEFRMIFIITAFTMALLILEFIRYIKDDARKLLPEAVSVGLIGIFSIIFFLPWGLRLQGSKLISYGDFSSGLNSLRQLVTQDYQTWLNIRFYAPIGLIIIAALAVFVAIYKKAWLMLSIGLWVALMASLYALILIHVPWVQYVQSFAVIISLYIPLGIFVGYLAGEFTSRLSAWSPGKPVIVVVLLGIGIFGAWNLRNIANSDFYALVTRPDIQAMQWIKDNTPANSRFLIEGAHENWVTNVIGTDAGWWIPLLANRENTIPPQYALSNEQPNETDYSQGLVKLEAGLEASSVASAIGIKLLCDFGITHVYIGQKQGSVGNLRQPLFTPEALATSPVFQLIYQNDRVHIYSVENACNQ
jgi:hypothetical protein